MRTYEFNGMRPANWISISFFVSLLLLSPTGQIPAAASELGQGAQKPNIPVPNLPCVEVTKRYQTDAVTLVYIAETLYDQSAILPTQQGLDCLNKLAGWLKTLPHISWQVSVGGEPVAPFSPMAVAEKRKDLLLKFFQRKGLAMTDWSWQAITWRVNGQQIQLRLKSLP